MESSLKKNDMMDSTKTNMATYGDFSTRVVRQPSYSDQEKNVSAPPTKSMPSHRLLVASLGMLALTSGFATQSSMSSALICMSDDVPSPSTYIEQSPNISNTNAIFVHNSSHSYSQPSVILNYSNSSHGSSLAEVTNTWTIPLTSDQKGFSVSMFFISYYIMQLPSGLLAARFGYRRTLAWSLALTALFQILTVPSAFLGINWLYLNRFLAGMANGPIFASTISLTANWAPRPEISKMFGFTGIGIELGNAVSFAISSFACNTSFLGGWPLVFYTLAAFALLVAILETVLVTDSPSNNRFSSDMEKNYILSNSDVRSAGSSKVKTPFKAILTSIPIICMLVAMFATEWTFYMAVTQVPIYLKDVLRLTDTQVSLTSGLPYLCAIPTTYLSGILSDTLVFRGIMSSTNMRKMNEGLTKLLPAATIICLGFIPSESPVLAFALSCFLASGISFCYVGYGSNVADLCPAFTPFVTALGQASGTWVSFLIPVLFSAMTQQGTREEWQTLFYITACINVAAFVVYATWGSAELQPWARVKDMDVVIDSSRFHISGRYSRSVDIAQRRDSRPKKVISNDGYNNETSPLLGDNALS